MDRQRFAALFGCIQRRCWSISSTRSSSSSSIGTSSSSSSSSSKLRTEVDNLVACDIFVTAGGDKEQHYPVLHNLLQFAQDRLRSKVLSSLNDSGNNRNIMNDPWVENAPVGALVHARCDPVYNRSSFHLAGSESVLSEVAAELAVRAVQQLRELRYDNRNHHAAAAKTHNFAETPYPSMGLVDQVSTMPLIPSTISTSTTPAQITLDAIWKIPATKVARAVGDALRQSNVMVFFYGPSHKHNRSLSDVRGKQTRYLKRLAGLVPPLPPGSSNNNTMSQVASSSSSPILPELASVGSHWHYIEYFTVRMNAECGKKRARHIRRLINDYHDSKLPYVDALSLPYSSDGRFDIACTLQRPIGVGGNSATDVLTTIQRFIKTCKDDVEIETSFRLRPTAVQSLDVLRHVSRSDPKRTQHDKHVVKNFQKYFE